LLPPSAAQPANIAQAPTTMIDRINRDSFPESILLRSGVAGTAPFGKRD
jgi:hypothetical protein